MVLLNTQSLLHAATPEIDWKVSLTLAYRNN